MRKGPGGSYGNGSTALPPGQRRTSDGLDPNQKRPRRFPEDVLIEWVVYERANARAREEYSAHPFALKPAKSQRSN